MWSYKSMSDGDDVLRWSKAYLCRLDELIGVKVLDEDARVCVRRVDACL